AGRLRARRFIKHDTRREKPPFIRHAHPKLFLPGFKVDQEEHQLAGLGILLRKKEKARLDRKRELRQKCIDAAIELILHPAQRKKVIRAVDLVAELRGKLREPALDSCDGRARYAETFAKLIGIELDRRSATGRRTFSTDAQKAAGADGLKVEIRRAHFRTVDLTEFEPSP